MSLVPEFDPRIGESGRLLVSIRGDLVCLVALQEELSGLGFEVAIQEGRLTALAFPGAEADRVLPAVAAAIERITAGNGGSERVLLEQVRLVPTRMPSPGEAIRLGERFVIHPAGGDRQAAEHLLLLAPSHAFGSGLHPSTRLAVQVMEEMALQPNRFPGKVLDVGTGSGLLALVAARLGAESVVGIDVTAEAVEAATRNVALNRLGDRVRVAATPLAAVAGAFDLILANLTVSVQLRLAADLQSLLGMGSQLIVSGLQGRQQEELASFWQNRGMRLVSTHAEGSWRALRLQRAGSPAAAAGP